VFEMTGIDMAKLESAILNKSAEVHRPPLPAMVPHGAMLRFEDGKPSVIASKVLEFAEALHREGHPKSLSEDELSSLRAAATSTASPPLFAEGQLALLPLLLAWPHSRLFPVLDALRLALVQPRTAAAVAAQDNGAGCVLNIVRIAALAVDAGEVNHMMALRCFCNLLASAPKGVLVEGGVPLIAALLEATAAAEVHAATRRGARVAFATLLLNVSVLLRSQRADCERKTPVVCALQQCLTTPQPDAEVRFRVVLALGTLVHDDEDTAALCVALELAPTLLQLRAAYDATEKLRACATEVISLLERAQVA